MSGSVFIVDRDTPAGVHDHVDIELAGGRSLRYNDPALGIDWPLEVSAIADRDLTWPDLRVRGKSSSTATGEVLH